MSASPTATQPPGVEPIETLVDRLIREQQTLRPVERFSRARDRLERAPLPTSYRDRIPLSRPGPGEQYAFEVDFDQCTGCKACVSACHSLNGLEDEETWRDIGLLVGDFAGPGYQQTVTTACHHCEDPACSNGCPVLAYEKDPETGIVRHLDDQCIGCQYCSLKCPYDVPKYSVSKGIVRKCDLCHSRLAVGEAPACVQACPTSAIRVVTVASGAAPSDGPLLPGTVESSYTRPTTRYVGKRTPPADAQPADRGGPRPEHAHLPLVWMLTLTQAGLGLITGALFAGKPGPWQFAGVDGSPAAWPGWAGLTLLLLGMGASLLHLGQPLKAWRVFLGLRKSWLSREVLAFGLVPPVALAALLLPGRTAIPFFVVSLALVFTSVMVYADTRRQLWRFPRSAVRFFGTSFLFVFLGWGLSDGAQWLSVAAAAVLVLKIALEFGVFGSRNPQDRETCVLLRGALRGLLAARLVTGGLGILLLLSGSATGGFLSVGLLLLSEWLERLLFFRAVVAYRMPGC